MKKIPKATSFPKEQPTVPQLTVAEFLKEKSEFLKLRLIVGRKGTGRTIEAFEVNRPGLALAGYLNYFRAERIQVIGRGERDFIAKDVRGNIRETLSQMMSHKNLPCFVVTGNAEPPKILSDLCENYKIPLLAASWGTAHFLGELTPYLEDRLAPAQHFHAVLVDVYGLGVLILGQSGIGKSECALELLKRDHILISDDLVRVKRLPGEVLVGEPANPEFGRYLELRGLGIVDVSSLFGVGSVMEKTRLELAVTLEIVSSLKPRTSRYERIGLDEQKFNILGVDVPHVVFPVIPGRNLAILIEVAALNQRLKNQGVHSAKEFEKKLLKQVAL